MDDLTNAAAHLACIAGPDTAALIPLGTEWTVIGRHGQVACHDRSSSRAHFSARLCRHRAAVAVQIRDLGSANGTYKLRAIQYLPRAQPRWWWAIPCQGRRTSATAPLRPGNHYLRPGQCLLAGNNIWQLRYFPETVSLQSLCDHYLQPVVRAKRRWLFLIFPLMSLLWLAQRWLPLWLALTVLATGLSVLGYLYAWRQARRPHADPATFAIAAQLPVPSPQVHARTRISGPWIINLQAAPRVKTIGKARVRVARLIREPTSIQTVKAGAYLAVRAQNPGWLPWICLQLLVQIQNQGGVGRLCLQTDETGQQNWVIVAGEETIVHLRLLGSGGEQVSPANHVLGARGQPPRVEVTGTAWEAEESRSHGQVQLPVTLSLDELEVASRARPAEVKNAGRSVQSLTPISAGAKNDTPYRRGLAATVGVGETGPFTLDLLNDGPHALVAGTTGSGKSEALRTWLAQLVRTYSPQALRLILIDYKGGATLMEFADLPHCEGLFTDLQVAATRRVLYAIGRELRRREAACAQRRIRSINEWEATEPQSAPPRLLCVIDEFRALMQTHPELMEKCVDLAARGRSLGMHLIAATQSPAGVISAQMRANLTLRICLRTAQPADSYDVLGTEGAAQLPRLAGRALVDSGRGVEQIQWALTPPLSQVIDASTLKNEGKVSRLWQPPLTRARARELITQSRLAQNTKAPPFAVGECARDGRHQILDLAAPVLACGPLSARRELLRHIGEINGAYLYLSPSRPGDSGAPKYFESLADDATAQVLAIRAARRAGVPILVEDVGHWWQQCDQRWGTGAGRKIWEDAVGDYPHLVVGASLQEGNKLRQGHRMLISARPTEIRQYGWEKELAQALEDAWAFTEASAAWVGASWEQSDALNVVLAGAEDTDAPVRERCARQWREQLEDAIALQPATGDSIGQRCEQAGQGSARAFLFTGSSVSVEQTHRWLSSWRAQGVEVTEVSSQELFASAGRYRHWWRQHPVLVAGACQMLRRELDLPIEVDNQCWQSQVWLLVRDQWWRLGK